VDDAGASPVFAMALLKAARAGDETGREIDFRESMTKHGFARARTKTTRGFRGVKLNRPDLGSDLRYAD
jgi:hypothetical protein